MIRKFSFLCIIVAIAVCVFINIVVTEKVNADTADGWVVVSGEVNDDEWTVASVSGEYDDKPPRREKERKKRKRRHPGDDDDDDSDSDDSDDDSSDDSDDGSSDDPPSPSA